jgi:hypothetical protein
MVTVALGFAVEVERANARDIAVLAILRWMGIESWK